MTHVIQPDADARDPDPADLRDQPLSAAQFSAPARTLNLDTLAKESKTREKSEAKRTLQKRARSIYISRAVAIQLAELRTKLEKSYRNSVYCSTTIVQEDDRLRTHYCSNRWCLQCNRIRTAKYINAYAPIIEDWPDPHFVTLTIPNVPAGELRPAIGHMGKTFYRSCVRGIQYGGSDFCAVRKLECTWSEDRGDFHPHYHVAVDGREVALQLRDRWLKKYPDASMAGQDVQKMREGKLIELFKYMTKLTMRSKTGERKITPPEKLDVIFQALRRRHTLRPYGFEVDGVDQVDVSGEEEIEDLEGTPAFKRYGEKVLWEWDQECADWIDELTGEVLSEYELPDTIRSFVEGGLSSGSTRGN